MSEKIANLFDIETELFEAMTHQVLVDKETGEVIDLQEAENDVTLSNKAEAILYQLKNQEQKKADSIAYVFKHVDAEIQFLKDEQARITQRRMSLENRQKRFKDYVKDVFQRFQIQKIKGHKHTIFLRNSEFVFIDESIKPAELPKEYRKEEIIYSPMKKELKEALQAGKKIKGVELKPSCSLNIR